MSRAARPTMITMPCRRARTITCFGATLGAGLAMLLLPGGSESASLWHALMALFPDSARSCFALGWASLAGALAYLAAEAARDRRIVRPAATAALVAALLSPAALAAPLWAALLAAAGLLASPAPPRRAAANDNWSAAESPANPVALAA